MQFLLPVLLLVLALTAVYADIAPFEKNQFCKKICPNLKLVKKKAAYKAITKINCKDIPKIPEETCANILKEAEKNKEMRIALEKGIGEKVDEWKEECKKLCK